MGKREEGRGKREEGRTAGKRFRFSFFVSPHP